MIPMSFGEIASAIDGKLSQLSAEQIFSGDIATDSRSVKPGDLFIAIKGLNYDGHDYLAQVMQQGAVAVVVGKPIENIPHILVTEKSAADELFSQSTIWALAKLAKYVHKNLNQLTTIAITGSSGKTTTKDLISQLGNLLGDTVFAQESANNEIGVPLTILRCTEETKVLVLEMGARRMGNIKYLVDIAKPDMSVITHIGSAHVEIFGSIENLTQTKSEIIKSLTKEDFAILNSDDPKTSIIKSSTKAQVFLFGIENQADLWATDIDYNQRGCASFTLNYKDQKAKVQLQLVGGHNISNALAAAAPFLIKGIDLSTVAKSLNECKSLSKWRMQEISASRDVLIINDAYNANPESTQAALRGLRQVAKDRRKIAILGEMKELGELSESAHQQIGSYAAELGIDHLLVVGAGAKAAVAAAKSVIEWTGQATFHEDIDALMIYAKELITSHDVVLVKASRSIGLEAVVDQLVENLGEK